MFSRRSAPGRVGMVARSARSFPRSKGGEDSTSPHPSLQRRGIFLREFGPARRGPFVSAKGPKTMGARAWPYTMALSCHSGNKCQKELVFSLGREAHTSETRRWEKPRTSPFVHHRTPLLNGFNTKRRNLRCLKAFLLISPTLFGIYSHSE